MTEQEVLNAISIYVPVDRAPDREVIASAHLKKAILRMGRTPGAPWTYTDVAFTLTSGQSRYHLGQDILADFPDAKNLQTLWRTDTQDDPIAILPVSGFNKYARGSTTTGSPQIATIHSDDEELEIWPEPDSNYPLWGFIRKSIQNFVDIPSDYHDVLIDIAVASMKAGSDPRVALSIANAGLKQASEDSLTKWDGTTIPLSRHLGKDYSGSKADSGNLRGD